VSCWGATATPAKILGLEGITSTLRPGADADVAIIELRDGACEFRDSDGNTATGKRRLVTRVTLKEWRVLYERPAA
jgi:predicted amidohydrolase